MKESALSRRSDHTSLWWMGVVMGTMYKHFPHLATHLYSGYGTIMSVVALTNNIFKAVVRIARGGSNKKQHVLH